MFHFTKIKEYEPVGFDKKDEQMPIELRRHIHFDISDNLFTLASLPHSTLTAGFARISGKLSRKLRARRNESCPSAVAGYLLAAVTSIRTATHRSISEHFEVRLGWRP